MADSDVAVSVGDQPPMLLKNSAHTVDANLQKHTTSHCFASTPAKSALSAPHGAASMSSVRTLAPRGRNMSHQTGSGQPHRTREQHTGTPPSFFNKATDPKHAGRTVVPGYGYSIDEADSAMGTQLHTDYRSGPAFLYDHEQAICNEAWRKQ